MHFYTSLAVPAFLTLANAAVIGKRAASGEATFYGGNVAGGACSFSTYTLPSNIFGTALSDSNWDNSANCGACVSVTGPDGNAITAMIVDECPGCGLNHLDLFPTAFSTLANPSTGVIDVAWSYVDCPITSPLQLHQKEGVSVYWFSMQVVNANKAVSKLEVSTDGGSTWQGTTRQTYNFFENSSGFGVKTMDIKVTSSDGEEVIVKNVEVGAGSSVTADSNFASSGSTAASSSAAGSSVAVSSSAPAPTSSTSVVPSSSTSAPVVSTSEAPLPATTTSVPGANFHHVSSSSSIVSSTQVASSPAAIIPTTSTSTAAPQYAPTSTLPASFSTSALTTSALSSEPTFVYVDACEP